MQQEFDELFRPVLEQLDSVSFHIESARSKELEDMRLFAIVVEGKGNKDWSLCKKVVVVSNTGHTLFESALQQIHPGEKVPECGVPSITVDSVYKASLNSQNYVFVAINRYYYPCGGQDETESKTLHIYSTENLIQIDTLNTYLRRVNSTGFEILHQVTVECKGNLLICRGQDRDNDKSRNYTKRFNISDTGLVEQK